MFGFGSSASLSITLSPPPSGLFKDASLPASTSATSSSPKPGPGDAEAVKNVPVYTGADAVSGEVRVELPQGKKLEHLGVKVELFGRVEMFYDRGGAYDFVALVRELEAPGVIYDSKSVPFSFEGVEKPYESYRGLNVRVRYFVRATVTKSYSGNLQKEQELCVQATSAEPELNNSIKMEVGIEDCLHIEFEYEKQK
ncbi:hypothetical protein TeGR_g7635, partial [Tetraparma gracilis]